MKLKLNDTYNNNINSARFLIKFIYQSLRNPEVKNKSIMKGGGG